MTTSKQVPNPTGKGGFGERPQDINLNGWKGKDTFSYCMEKFKRMTIEEFEQWQKDHPKSKRTVAEDLAIRRVIAAQDKLEEFREVANRTEGFPLQRSAVSGNVNGLFGTGEGVRTYDEYVARCAEVGIDPVTGLRVSRGEDEVEQDQDM